MNIKIKNGKEINIRLYEEADFNHVQQLNNEEGWANLVERGEVTKEAWRNSNITYVVEESKKIIGYIRGLTDKQITLYICEILIDKGYRGFGIGESLLKYVHSLYPKTRMEMLASSSSRSYYEVRGFRSFYGFRKTIEE
jgi:ribosomal protein S18 acetylase RimI-like enzyme